MSVTDPATPTPVVVADSKLKRPDITPAQMIAGIPIVAGLLRAFGVYDLGEEQQDALESAMEYSLALLGADAIIRFGRNIARR